MLLEVIVVTMCSGGLGDESVDVMVLAVAMVVVVEVGIEVEVEVEVDVEMEIVKTQSPLFFRVYFVILGTLFYICSNHI